MTEIQRLLTETIESLNTREKRDNKPALVSVLSVNIRGCLSVCTLLFATTAVMLQSETLSGSVWLLVVLFILLNGFFFFDVHHATVMKISTCWISAFAITANGTTRALYLPRWLKPS